MAPFPCSVTAHHGVSRFLTVAGIPVRLTIFDPHYSAEWSESIVFSYPRLVLMIPGQCASLVRFSLKCLLVGNPGEIGYYDQLMALVHDRCNLPVIGVSYAGHNPLPDNRKLPGEWTPIGAGLTTQSRQQATTRSVWTGRWSTSVPSSANTSVPRPGSSWPPTPSAVMCA